MYKIIYKNIFNLNETKKIVLEIKIQIEQYLYVKN